MVKRAHITIGPGQSNEVGSGETNDFTPSFGCPQRDPVKPNGSATMRSMWPYLSELLGRRGVWATFNNAAVGSTSVVENWCGRIRAWASGIKVVTGSYCLNAGVLWKVSAAGSALATSTSVPAAGLQADGVTWASLGAPPGYAIDGYICKHTDGLFDPNGLFAAALVGAAAATGYDQKLAIISLGQHDAAMYVSAADYSTGLINATNYWLANGVKVFLGMTCYDAAAGMESQYQSVLLPGLAMALAYFSGNTSVFPGANLRTALGVLPVTPAWPAPGLKADQVHMNNSALALASEAWAGALKLAGV